MIQTAQDIARATLAACSSFQSLVDADDAAEALERIYHDALPLPISGRAEHGKAELEVLRPYAIVYTEFDSGYVLHRDAMGDQSCWNANGVINFVICRSVPEADRFNPSKISTDFRGIIDDIVEQFVALSETASYLSSRRVTVSSLTRTSLTHVNDIGDEQICGLKVEWGVGE